MEQIKTNSNPFSAGLRIGGANDSRVGSASGGGDADGDTAFTATLSAGWQVPFKSDFGFRLDYGGYADFHQDFDEYDVIDQSFSVEPQWTKDQITVSMPFIFNYAMEDGDTNYNRYTISPTVTYLIPQTSQAVAVYGIASRIDDRDDDNTLDEDGKTYGGGCAYLYFFQNKSRIRLSMDYQHTHYDAWVVDYGTGSVATDDRKDDSFVASVDIQFQLNEFFGVYTNYSFIHSSSNVDLYKYDRNIIEVGVAFKY